MLAATAAHGQEVPVAAPTPAAPIITEQDIARAAAEHARMPTPQEVEQAARSHALRFDALPRPASSQTADLAAIARGFPAEGSQSNAALFAGTEPSLFVFVSFSMPEAALRSLAAQAARAGATLVLRGMIAGSLQQTARRVQAVIGSHQLGFQIDPQAFDRFGVQAVPTYVLARPGGELPACASGSCAVATDFVSVAGDVSMDYALLHIESHAPGYASEARAFLAKLGARR
ncbi:MAG TPA: type-F conjugative transfer system pilin assembly protein TrbC [Burkholderiaceae bacterium]|nr:type-F conjugative transfer system pilin assembly protein TrbC [Burkholderiaceae bacterium]